MKVVFDGNKTATGVMVKQPGLSPYMLSANKEVILSAEVVSIESYLIGVRIMLTVKVPLPTTSHAIQSRPSSDVVQFINPNCSRFSSGRPKYARYLQHR